MYKEEIKKERKSERWKTLTFIELFIVNILCECCFSFKIEWILCLLAVQSLCAFFLSLLCQYSICDNFILFYFFSTLILNWNWIGMKMRNNRKKQRSYLKKNLRDKKRNRMWKSTLIDDNSKAYKQFDALNWHIEWLAWANTIIIQSCWT